MMAIALLVNTIACLAIFWVCGTFLIVADRVDCWRRALLQGALLVTMGGAFAGGLAPLAGHPSPTWWTLLLRVGVATLALMQFDQSFGIVRQLRALGNSVRTAPVRVQGWWQERVTVAQRYTRRRQQ